MAGLALRAGAVEGDVIINEIMYHPPLDLEQLQYVELHNRSAAAVDLAGWSFTKGIKFKFPANIRLEGGAYLVVCRDREAFATVYGKTIRTVGDFGGKLSNDGENLELSDAAGQVVEALRYSDDKPWPAGPDGYSASLERICPTAPANDPANWAGSKLPAIEKPAGTPGSLNDSFSNNLPPVIDKVGFVAPAPRQKAVVRVEVAEPDTVKSVTLLYRVARPGGEGPETGLPMQRVEGDERRGKYQGEIDGQPEGALVRFRVKAIDANGAVRHEPAVEEPRPTYSYSTYVNTNDARVGFAYAINVSQPAQEGRYAFRRARSSIAEPCRGNGAFIYAPAGSREVVTYDHVHLRPRGGGFKAHFLKDQLFKGMSGINVIFEGSPRYALAEPLAYEVYRLAGVPAPLAGHARVWVDGRPIGYQLLVEQPNKTFLKRNQRDNSGNLYKLLWYGRGIEGQHEKKTNPTSGHEDVAEIIEGLNRTTGAEQWAFIQKHFNVDEFASYFAVNMCIQNWDGFHNNYFAYHDLEGTGKWEIYPWDEDKTWGDFDGSGPPYAWYTMPLTMGMKGDPGPGRGWGSWWRPGGWFSGPMLANPDFRRRFLDRLEVLCKAVFTEEKLKPIIDDMEKRLEPEVRVRARLQGVDPSAALKAFRADIQSFREQVVNRRKYILAELPKAKK